LIRGALVTLACAALCAGCLDWNFSSSGLDDAQFGGDGMPPRDAGSDAAQTSDGMPPNRDLATPDLASNCPPGTIAFANPEEHLVDQLPMSLAIGDLNGDGKLDIVSANQGGKDITVLMYDKVSGNYDSMTIAAPATSMLTFVTIADLDGNGAPDVVTADDNAIGVSIFGNAGGGMFNSLTNAKAGNAPYAIAVGYLNADTYPDLAVADLNSGFVSILINKQDGTFTQPNSPIAIGQSADAVVFGDLDVDGKLDLVVGDADDLTIAVLFGDGTGQFGATMFTGVNHAPTLPGSLAVGDLNGDGAPDLAVASSDGTVSVMLNNLGRNGLAAPSDHAVMQSPSSVAIGDLDLDGRPDLVVSTSADGMVNVLRQIAMNKFTQPVSFPAGKGTQQLQLVDLNGDGRLDVATVNRDSNSVSVLLATCK
jgi:hypothetical protein